ncbi:MAG: cobalamin-binding protein [Propionibacteriales bacterium]|nr:cobalamin-binding protein [Propionibacteriales bacterium]
MPSGDVDQWPAAPRRIVSLVPSLTETVAVSAPELLVGVTDWCTHPAELDAARVGGTKNPRTDDVVRLRPDVVLANSEENRGVDLDALRSAGVPVWVTDYETVPDALAGLAELLAMLGLGHPQWLSEAEAAWAGIWSGPRCTALVPIWRRPWMAVGRDTFMGDMLRRLGVDNVLSASEERYPRVDLETVPAHDVVVLPDEPYAFDETDGPEAFSVPARLVSGRHLTWYGPSMAEAAEVLTRQLWP